MKSFLPLLPAIAALLLSACATGYEKAGLAGDGFDDAQLAPDTFRIKFTGNEMTSTDRAHDFALLRAADLTLKAGYSYFAIVNESNQTHQDSFTLPSTETTTGNVVANANAYGTGQTVYTPHTDYYNAQSFGSAMANYNQTTTYVPGQTITSISPETGLMIRCFNSKQPDIYTFDAVFLEKSLRSKYGLPPLK